MNENDTPLRKLSRETDKTHCQCQNKLQEISEHYGMSTSNYYIQKVRKVKNYAKDTTH